MNKTLVKKLIKEELKKYLKEEELDLPKDLDSPPLETGMDTILNKFPKVREILIDLLTNEFETFVKDIYWVAPKPSTFKIILNNSQYFFLTWYKITFIVQVGGKKYYLANVGEEERAIKAINDLLKMGNPKKSPPPSDGANKPDLGGDNLPPIPPPSGRDKSLDDLTPDEIPQI